MMSIECSQRNKKSLPVTIFCVSMAIRLLIFPITLPGSAIFSFPLDVEVPDSDSSPTAVELLVPPSASSTLPSSSSRVGVSDPDTDDAAGPPVGASLILIFKACSKMIWVIAAVERTSVREDTKAYRCKARLINKCQSYNQ
jgi:hypothetical protein